MKAYLATLALGAIAFFAPSEAQARDRHDHYRRDDDRRCNDSRSYSSYRVYRYYYSVPRDHCEYRDPHHRGASPRYDRYGRRIDSHGHYVDRYGRHR